MKLLLNWKQNGSYEKVLTFLSNLNSFENIVLFLPFTLLSFANKITIGAQNVSKFKEGAFTGEVGANMLKEVGAKYCLVGHSERRTYFKEGTQDLQEKLLQLKQHNITAVLCVGESLEERQNGKIFEVLKSQMQIFNQNILIAYEPVWSIGTGIVAKIEEIEEVANFFKQNYNIEIYYGGSVNENNIKEILNIKNVKGVLVGGASLDVEKVKKMQKLC